MRRCRRSNPLQHLAGKSKFNENVRVQYTCCALLPRKCSKLRSLFDESRGPFSTLNCFSTQLLLHATSRNEVATVFEIFVQAIQVYMIYGVKYSCNPGRSVPIATNHDIWVVSSFPWRLISGSMRTRNKASRFSIRLRSCYVQPCPSHHNPRIFYSSESHGLLLL